MGIDSLDRGIHYHEPSNENPGTLISQEELIERALVEGVDVSNIDVVTPRWAESAGKTTNSSSALIRCDLILRSDGSAVWLDGNMSIDSWNLTYNFLNRTANPHNLSWENWVQTVRQFP